MRPQKTNHKEALAMQVVALSCAWCLVMNVLRGLTASTWLSSGPSLLLSNVLLISDLGASLHRSRQVSAGPSANNWQMVRLYSICTYIITRCRPKRPEAPGSLTSAANSARVAPVRRKGWSARASAGARRTGSFSRQRDKKWWQDSDQDSCPKVRTSICQYRFASSWHEGCEGKGSSKCHL